MIDMNTDKRKATRTGRFTASAVGISLRAVMLLLMFSVGQGTVAGAAESAELVPVDGKTVECRLVGVDPDWELRFEATDEKIEMPAQDIVRWGRPVEPTHGPVVVLRDGSYIIAQISAISATELTIDSRHFGQIRLPAAIVRGVVFQRTGDRPWVDVLLDTETGEDTSAPGDRILLANSDWLTGLVVGVDAGRIRMLGRLGEVRPNLSQVTALWINRPSANSSPAAEEETTAPLRAWVGLVDGSRLLTDRVVLGSDWLTITAAGQTLETLAEDICWLRPVGGRAVSLTEIRPVGFRHLPYLSISETFRIDRNVERGTLRAGDEIYARGIGVPTTSRLTYSLDGSYRRFDTKVGIDTAARGRGSARFRIYVDGRAVYTSPIVRGTDSLLEISIPIEGAKRLDLITDFADRADQQDYADWLDPRLVK